LTTPEEQPELNAEFDDKAPKPADPCTQQPAYTWSEGDHRASTLDSYYQAVQQVISAMHERFAEPLSLQDMADIASLSPSHFSRVFRCVTGVTPFHFLAALRLKAAKRLLLTTDMSVAEVCFEVGYNSLGTFTTRFTQLVGLSPTQLRDLADDQLLEKRLPTLDQPPGPDQDAPYFYLSTPGVQGRIIDPHGIPDRATGYIFVGLFQTAIPQGQPVGCTLLVKPGLYQISPTADGCYYIFAAAFPKSSDPLPYLVPDSANLKVGMGQRPVTICGGQIDHCPAIRLRPMCVTDPPILSALPFFLMEHWANLEMAF